MADCNSMLAIAIQLGVLKAKIPTTLQTPNFIKGILDTLVYDQCFGRPFLVESLPTSKHDNITLSSSVTEKY